MLKVFVAQHHAEAHLVKGLLQSHDIAADVRGEALFTTMEAASILPGAAPEVWVLHPSQAPQAEDLIRRFVKGEAFLHASGSPWPCPKCGETLEPQFTTCWKCGAAKPSPASAG